MTAMPLPQSLPFLRAAYALGWPVTRVRDGARCWTQTARRWRGIGPLTLVSRGPVDGIDPGWLAARRGAHLLNPDAAAPELLRAAGYWPLMTPATLAVLPLVEPSKQRASLHQKWRNRLNRAAAEGLAVRETRLPPRADHWLLLREAEQARTRGYRGWPPALCAAIAATTKGAARLLVAERRGSPVAALVLLLHAPGASYQIGWSSAEGRACHAMNLLLWHAARLAREHGCTELDLGPIDTANGAGLAHFKLGTGAEARRLGGSWLRVGALAPVARYLPRCLAA